MYSEYWNYFKNLCVNHPKLQHQDTAGEKVFSRADITEVFTGFRMDLKAKGYGFILLDPTSVINEPGSSNILQEYEGGFIICKYFKRDDNSSFITAIEETEEVYKDIVERMIHDSQNGFPMFNFSLNKTNNFNAQITQASDGSYAGWMVTFSYKNQAMIQSRKDCPQRVNWIDGGLTQIT